MKKKNKNFVKPNKCPYCTYPCESASMIQGEGRPHPGCISFCLMCGEPSVWDEKMKLIKFDLDSIPNLIERNRIKLIGLKMEEFWETHPDKDGRRAKYLKIKDRRCK